MRHFYCDWALKVVIEGQVNHPKTTSAKLIFDLEPSRKRRSILPEDLPNHRLVCGESLTVLFHGDRLFSSAAAIQLAAKVFPKFPLTPSWVLRQEILDTGD
jgi:hypothetical protein